MLSTYEVIVVGINIAGVMIAERWCKKGMNLLLAGRYSAPAMSHALARMKHFSFGPACSANVTFAAVSTAMTEFAASQLQQATLTNAGD